MNNRAIAQCGAHLLLGEHCRAAPTTAPLQPASTLYTCDSAVTKPWTQSRPFTSAFGFLSRKMSNGASVNEIFIPPNRTRVCCSVLGRRQGCFLCSCCLSLGESKSYFLLMRTIRHMEKGWVRGPMLLFQIEPCYPCCWQNSSKNALRKSPVSPLLTFPSTNKALLLHLTSFTNLSMSYYSQSLTIQC